MEYNFKPLNDKLLIKVDAAEEVSFGGIIIPTTAKEKPQTGTVVSVGEKTTTVKIGDGVYFPKGGTEIVVNKESLLILRESDIFGIYARE
jgi:chaperonin GroES